MVKILILVALGLCTATATSTEGNRFAADLFAVVTKENPLKNVIFSPASIQTCIAFAFAGANGKTAEEMQKSLYLGEGDQKTVLRNYREYLLNAFGVQKEDSPVLKMANRIFVNENKNIKPEFQEITLRTFNAQAENVNFGNSDETINHINNWIGQKTNHKIENLLQPGSVDSQTSSVLVNAIYFKGEWEETFSDYLTKKRSFYLNAQKEIKTDIMLQESEFNYAELPEYDAKALELKYSESDISMLIILPNDIEGLTKLESKLQGVDLNEIISKMTEEDVKVFLPKFRIEFDLNLNEALKELGMTTMFTSAADFSNMFESSSPSMVTDVVHSAFLDVNEMGSEAAAATYFKVIDYSINRNQKTFNADHPFVFAIRSPSTVYFAGHVANFN